MLDTWIIKDIHRKEKLEKRPRPYIYRNKYEIPPSYEKPKKKEDSSRGVIIIDM